MKVFCCDAEYETKEITERKTEVAKPFLGIHFLPQVFLIQHVRKMQKVCYVANHFVNILKRQRQSYPRIPALHLPLRRGCLLNWVSELTASLTINK